MPVPKSVPCPPEKPSEDWHKVVENPIELRRKVPSFGGVDPEEAYKKAEEIVSDLSGEYAEKLDRDIEKLEALVAAYKNAPSKDTLRPIYRIVHNMRGQGTTFGFPLVTQIGRSFCKYYSETDQTEMLNPELVMDHLEALKLVCRKHMAGAGNDMAQAVVSGLQKAVDKAVERKKGKKTRSR